MFVIVNGSKFQAAQAAADRGIPFAFRQEHKDCGIQTSGYVPDTFEGKVQRWFCETPNVPPFPIGTCLHYGGIQWHLSKQEEPEPYSDEDQT